MSDANVAGWQPSKRLQRGNAAEQILEDLREQILSGRLARGTKLPTEKQLAEGYGVSGATIREAIRGLVTSQLIEVRHGSGAYVTAETDQLIAQSLSSMIQIDRIGVPEVLGVLGALVSYAAEMAATHATADDIDAMRNALSRIQDGESVEAISGGISAFVGAIGQASKNSLLATLCRFFTRVQIGLATELSGGSLESWRTTSGQMREERRRILKAIEAKDAKAARTAALSYHERALKVITAQPNANTAMVSDPAMAAFLSMVLQRGA